MRFAPLCRPCGPSLLRVSVKDGPRYRKCAVVKIERSREYWLRLIDSEPDCPISAGIPEYRSQKVGRLGCTLLRLRARLAFVWRFGLVSRGTAFRWEMDAFLGEWSR